METETRKRKLWRELIDEAETACEKNPHQMIGWLASKLATALLKEEEHSERERQHQLRLQLAIMSYEYQDEVDPERKQRLESRILQFIDTHDFGCLVEFNAETGDIDFIERDDE